MTYQSCTKVAHHREWCSLTPEYSGKWANCGKDIELGSICSGGSYAKLISRFRGVDVPGTGISFGVDRLLFALSQLNQIDVEDQKPVLVCDFKI